MKNLNLKLNISINSLKKRKNNKKEKQSKDQISQNFEMENLFNNSLIDITHKEIDGKIGLREPIYCFCNYVSYGDMVKCDNSKVKSFFNLN